MGKLERGDGGQFEEKVSDQAVLLVFDAADEPVLTAAEVAEELPITREATGRRLNRMADEGLVGRKETGAHAVAWWANVAPKLSEDTIVGVEHGRREVENGDTVALSDA